MNVITDIVRNIVALVLIFSCFELFLPKGELSKFIRLGFGIILLALIIIPASEALSNASFENPFQAEQSTVSADYQQRSEQISMILEQEAMTEYENDLARQISAIAFMADGVTSARALAETNRETGSILRVEVTAATAVGSDFATVEANIYDMLAKYFVIDEENIHIQLREDI